MLFSADVLWILLLAFAFDALIGGAEGIWRYVPHPAALFGRLARRIERTCDRPAWGDARRWSAGLAAAAALIALAFAGGWGVERLVRLLPAGQVLLALIASLFIAQRSLYDHVVHVASAFAMGGLHWAREALASIIGADANRLDRPGVCRATIESCAENFATDVVAPVFWFALFGLPGLLAYKAISIADAVIARRAQDHSGFAQAFARFDDVLTYLPARFAGLLFALVAAAGGGSLSLGLKTIWRDAARYTRLNAGWPLSAVAGALDLALGGSQVRNGRVVDAPVINPRGRRTATIEDIDRARRLLFAACLLQIVLYALVSLARR